MEDRSNEIISQYDMKIYRSYRARGGMVLETDQGLKFLSPCRASERRMEFEDVVKRQMQEHGYRNLDGYIRNREGKLTSANSVGERYCVRDWFSLEECSMKREESIFLAAENLALLHLAMTDIRVPEGGVSFEAEDLYDTFERRNRELKRVRSYLGKRKNKTAFEIRYLNCSGSFYEEAQKAAAALAELEARSFFEESIRNGNVIHGSYTYHNILMEQKAEKLSLRASEYEAGAGIATVNFDKAVYGIQVCDLYQYMRKVMEKNNWQYSLGSRLLAAYEKVRALSAREKKLLCVLLSYPEKFWKITNYYYNSRKSLIPQKNMDKLEMLLEQQERKNEFLQELGRF